VVVATFLTNHAAPQKHIHSARLDDRWPTPQEFREDVSSGDRYGGRQCWYDSDVPRCE
jgi:hypothetical protein